LCPLWDAEVAPRPGRRGLADHVVGSAPDRTDPCPDGTNREDNSPTMTFVRRLEVVECRCGWRQEVWPPSDQLAVWLRDIHRVQCPLNATTRKEIAA
jgi:hypothetical protein